ncbi:MAG: transaldolase, partial [Nitrosospira sp.]|nr:transaldolase [Nitrosospira sp.]
MKPLKALHEKIGESIWMDNIRRGMLKTGQLERYIEKFSLTGLTSNPTIFEHAIGGGGDYDEGIRKHLDDAKPDAEKIFFEMAIEDLQDAADLFSPTFDKSKGRDGFVSLELAPGLADDAEGSIKQARELASRAQRPNLLIKVPGTEAGATVIETLIYEGIPVNVTLLFSPDQYKRAADAYLKGIERRIAEGRNPKVPSVASLFISRWDKASADKLPDELDNKLGVAIGMQTYRACCELYDSPRWKKLADQGALRQRLLWASTGTKDPSLPDDYYIYNLTAPDTINTVPEATLFAVVDNGR